MNAPMPYSPIPTPESKWTRFGRTAGRGFHRYATWLASISWWRFILLAILLMIVSGMLQSCLTFTSSTTEWVNESSSAKGSSKEAKAARKERASRESRDSSEETVSITIDGDGIRVKKEPRIKANPSSAAASTASASASAATPNPPATPSAPGTPATTSSSTSTDANTESGRRITIDVARDADSDDVRKAIEDAVHQARGDVSSATNASDDHDDSAKGLSKRVLRTTTRMGDALPELAFFWILGSAIIKGAYKGRLRAEAAAAVATENAEAETLKRQVVEARMAAMQAQIEPHFLFNTLASIDHLIETDPKRASVMQKHLIALLRASMPTMRESNGSGLRTLGSEMALIEPYLEILKVRMEDRLTTRIDVPEGLKSAAMPPMMLQGLVENAIKHGLEPKAEGGAITVKAEIIHGRLVVSVIDTGLGFKSVSTTSGTGVGLSNVRERLKLLYGDQAKLLITPNEPSGTVAAITVPYRSLDAA